MLHIAERLHRSYSLIPAPIDLALHQHIVRSLSSSVLGDAVAPSLRWYEAGTIYSCWRCQRSGLAVGRDEATAVPLDHESARSRPLYHCTEWCVLVPLTLYTSL
jgi:hypothetical protein